jgi:TatD DNase family protein
LYINVHSHNAGNGITVQSRYSGFDAFAGEGFYSAGLHPWYITAATCQQQLNQLEKIATQKNIAAIGECGLDKICPTDFALQQTAFTAQIQLANKINKPLVIHCVKAFDEVLHLLQQQQNKVPVIFHGFNKSAVLAQQLIHKGSYLSFGKALQQPRMQAVLKLLPVNKIFLETDDAAVSIEEIYYLAAQALQIDINALSLQLQKNANAVFGNTFLNL